MTSEVQSEPTLLDWWHCPDNFSMAAWQSPTVGLASEVWHTGGVRSGVEHCASTEVACAIAMAIRARLNIVAGYRVEEVSDGYDFSEKFYLLLSFLDVDGCLS